MTVGPRRPDHLSSQAGLRSKLNHYAWNKLMNHAINQGAISTSLHTHIQPALTLKF